MLSGLWVKSSWTYWSGLYPSFECRVKINSDVIIAQKKDRDIDKNYWENYWNSLSLALLFSLQCLIKQNFLAVHRYLFFSMLGVMKILISQSLFILGLSTFLQDLLQMLIHFRKHFILVPGQYRLDFVGYFSFSSSCLYFVFTRHCLLADLSLSSPLSDGKWKTHDVCPLPFSRVMCF